MSADVAYGQFLEAFEDAAIPLTESNQQEQPPFRGQTWSMMDYEIIRKFFRAMETVNNSQIENSESTMSLANASGNSLASMSSPSKSRVRLSPSGVFNAFQNVAINNNYGSTNSLASFDGSSPDEATAVPEVMQKMLWFVDEFMHNHSHLEETKSPKDTGDRFPKFC